MKLGKPGTTVDPTVEIQELTTVSLGAHPGKNQKVNYRLLLRDGHVIKAEHVQVNREIEGIEDMLAKADFTRFSPTGVPMQIVRTGQVFCRDGTCEVVVGP